MAERAGARQQFDLHEDAAAAAAAATMMLHRHHRLINVFAIKHVAVVAAPTQHTPTPTPCLPSSRAYYTILTPAFEYPNPYPLPLRARKHLTLPD